MKKIMALFVLASCASLLHASCGSYNQDSYYQGQYYQAPQGSMQDQPRSMQGQQDNYYQAPQSSMQGQYQGSYDQGSSYGSNYGDNMHPPRYGSNYSDNTSSSNMNTGNDQKTAADIKDSLQSAFSSKYNNVNVTVNNGYVTLQGTVPSQDDKNALEQKVRGMNGVRGVSNLVTVQGQSSTQSNTSRY